MIDWRNKEPGYYAPNGTLIWTWSELKSRRMIVLETFEVNETPDVWLKTAMLLEPSGGVLVVDPEIKLIEAKAFNRSLISGIVLNEGLQELWTMAFCDCRSLEFVIFPSTLTGIGRSAFRGCVSLKKVEINSPIAWIEGLTFKYCHSLEEVHIKSSVLTYIDEEAFAYCNKMHTCTIDAPIEHIGMCAFEHCYALKTYNKLTTPTFIHGWAFYGCTTINDVIHQKYQSYFERNGIVDKADQERIATCGIDAVELLMKY